MRDAFDVALWKHMLALIIALFLSPSFVYSAGHGQLRRSHLPYRKRAPSLHIPSFIMLTPAQLLLWNGEKWLSQLFPWASCKCVCAHPFAMLCLYEEFALCDELWLLQFRHDMTRQDFVRHADWILFIYLGCGTCSLSCKYTVEIESKLTFLNIEEPF